MFVSNSGNDSFSGEFTSSANTSLVPSDQDQSKLKSIWNYFTSCVTSCSSCNFACCTALSLPSRTLGDQQSESERIQDPITISAVRSSVDLEEEIKVLKGKRKKLEQLIQTHPDLKALGEELLKINPGAIPQSKMVDIKNFNPDNPIHQMTALGLQKDRLEMELRVVSVFIERHPPLLELFQQYAMEIPTPRVYTLLENNGRL